MGRVRTYTDTSTRLPQRVSLLGTKPPSSTAAPGLPRRLPDGRAAALSAVPPRHFDPPRFPALEADSPVVPRPDNERLFILIGERSVPHSTQEHERDPHAQRHGSNRRSKLASALRCSELAIAEAPEIPGPLTEFTIMGISTQREYSTPTIIIPQQSNPFSASEKNVDDDTNFDSYHAGKQSMWRDTAHRLRLVTPIVLRTPLGRHRGRAQRSAS
ncbi:hypothetical protein AAE478_005048 [Parahypoxylon ruwenzoriense]